jgi:hypothetical protein
MRLHPHLPEHGGRQRASFDVQVMMLLSTSRASGTCLLLVIELAMRPGC